MYPFASESEQSILESSFERGASNRGCYGQKAIKSTQEEIGTFNRFHGKVAFLLHLTNLHIDPKSNPQLHHAPSPQLQGQKP